MLGDGEDSGAQLAVERSREEADQPIRGGSDPVLAVLPLETFGRSVWR